MQNIQFQATATLVMENELPVPIIYLVMKFSRGRTGNKVGVKTNNAYAIGYKDFRGM
jgi:hypothetical protein